jgi:hypothetical protein
MVLQGSCPYCYEAAPIFPPVRILEMVEMADDASGSAPPYHLQGFHRLLLLSCFPRWPSTACHLGRHETGAVVAADGHRANVPPLTSTHFKNITFTLNHKLNHISITSTIHSHLNHLNLKTTSIISFIISISHFKIAFTAI